MAFTSFSSILLTMVYDLKIKLQKITNKFDIQENVCLCCATYSLLSTPIENKTPIKKSKPILTLHTLFV